MGSSKALVIKSKAKEAANAKLWEQARSQSAWHNIIGTSLRETPSCTCAASLVWQASRWQADTYVCVRHGRQQITNHSHLGVTVQSWLLVTEPFGRRRPF